VASVSDRPPQRLAIVGASLAGLRAAESARRSGYRGEIVLVGKEAHLPYDRPPLSKAFLTQREEPAFYHPATTIREELRIELRLGTAATAVNTDSRELALDDGSTCSYDRLVVATGVAPRRLSDLADLDGVLTLRTLDDAARLRGSLVAGARVVVVGAGLIGSELASSARAIGADAVLVEAAPIPLVRAVGSEVGQRLTALHNSHFTPLRCGVQVVGVEGEQRVSAVRLSNGERLPADLVILSVGAAPATSWLAGSGVVLNPLDGAVVCDETLQTSVPGIFAAGDVAEWPNEVMGVRMRQENWSSATEQGSIAGRNAVADGPLSVHGSVPYFWSDWYGSRIQFVGVSEAEEVEFHDLPPTADGFVALFRREGRLVGAATCNGQRLIMKLRRLIHTGAPYAAARAMLASAAGAA
jgi:NADPH-dependent 2,4-dienoyl-CoA reductase/sulfur reductase-like enzyme